MVKKIIKWPLMKLWALDKRNGIVTKCAMVFGIVLGSAISTFAAGELAGMNEITNRAWALVKLVRNILLAVTIGMTAWGGFSVANAFMNDKQNAPDTLKKFLLGIGISASITVVLSVVAQNSGSNEAVNQVNGAL